MSFLVGFIKRLLAVAPVLLAVTFVTFMAMNFLGDPLVNLLGPPDTSPEYVRNREAAEKQFHLDEPVPVRYARWLGDMATGDFGRSYQTQQSVSQIVKDKLPISLALMVLAQLIALVIAVPWAVLSAGRARSRIDRWGTTASFVLIATPHLALGVLLYYIFAVRLGWFPTRYDASGSVVDKLQALTLPALTLGLTLSASYQRLLRVDLLATLQEDFILTAQSKGLKRSAIMRRHALRPSLFSLMTVFGIQTGALIGGTLVVERIFTVPGVGLEIPAAVIRDDYPTVLAFVVIIACLFVVANVLVDMLYGVVDPRVRRSHG